MPGTLLQPEAPGQQSSAQQRNNANSVKIASGLPIRCTERFVRDICVGNFWFICGASPDEKPFNDEHVFPEWVLRRFDLFSGKVALPNEVAFRYDRYKVQCCVECNTMMGDLVENPVAEVVSGGATAINKFVENGGLLKMFVWMGLMFLKAHLRDRDFRLDLDARKGGGTSAIFMPGITSTIFIALFVVSTMIVR